MEKKELDPNWKEKVTAVLRETGVMMTVPFHSLTFNLANFEVKDVQMHGTLK